MTDAILVEALVKHYGSVRAIDGVDLHVPQGSILGLLGPNGAGKTTIVRILCTILRADSGRASVLGLDVGTQPNSVRANIGLAGQYAAVDENLTGQENLQMVGQLTHQPKAKIPGRAAELLERFDLTDAAHRPVRTYSGGMRRRLDLAAALVHRPPVLFLDEPTTGLDPRSRTDLWGVIGELVADGTTVLLTTQYLEEADRLAHNIVVIDNGKAIAEGTADELKRRIGQTVVEVELADAAAARQVVQLVSGVGPAELLDDGRSIGIKVADRGPALLEVVRRLDHAGVVPVTIDIREPTLDDVFLQLTGHRAEETGEADVA